MKNLNHLTDLILSNWIFPNRCSLLIRLRIHLCGGQTCGSAVVTCEISLSHPPTPGGLQAFLRRNNSLQTPIPLHIPDSRVHGQPCTFQDCVNKFFRDHSCDCALASAAPLLCFQLKRYEFNVRTGAVTKLVTPVSFTETSLQVPIWEDVSTLQTKQVCYQVSAIAFHEGRTPYAGHYRTCLLHQGCHYITDDNTEARMINPQLLRVVQSNSYLFLCHLQPQDRGQVS